MKKSAVPAIFGVLLLAFLTVSAQEPAQAPTQQPTQEELEKQKAEWSKNAYQLLDQVIDEAQSLRLTDNRVRVQITAADMLWDQNQPRARTLFSQAADGVAELMRSSESNSRQQGNQARRNQLRQQLILSAARHDATLAYQLLAVTRPATPAPTNADNRNPRAQFNSEDNLEQSLLSQVASLDPRLAGQNAEQMLDKGQFPRALADVISQLQRQDKDAAAKLTDKTLKRLQSANMLTNNEAASLALSLLAPGPRLQTTSNTSTPSSGQTATRSQVLDQSPYADLLSSVVDAALKATPQAQNNQRGPANGRGRGPNGFGNLGGQAGSQSPPTEAQIEQNNARRMLAGLQVLLPQVDQYLPSRAQLVRQKMTELGIGDRSRINLAQTFAALQQGNASTDAILQAAATAPQAAQARIYQQAAYKALDEGDTTKARQIATDHLQERARDAVMQRIEFRELAKKAEATRLDEIRQYLARVPSEKDRIDLLLQMAKDIQITNPKLSLQLLEEAGQITNRRATSYDNFEQQLKVAHAFAGVEPARSFDILDPAISQLNELLSAAAILNGFEISIFRDGELPLQGGSGLTSTVSRLGEELALLARNDFGRAETLAGRFQSAETRTLARLSIVQGLLGIEPPAQPNVNFFRGLGANFTFRDN